MTLRNSPIHAQCAIAEVEEVGIQQFGVVRMTGAIGQIDPQARDLSSTAVERKKTEIARRRSVASYPSGGRQ
jgi:hypothetical protein